MLELKELLDGFIMNSKNILSNNLTGIYLHGSAAMGCFNDKKSDIDLIVVVKNDISKEIKRQYMDMVVTLNREAPSKGIELSIVKESVCKPFIYPTPYELHFSITHLNWYLSDPDDYIEKMNGTDKDLAAHFTIVYHRGKTLYGREIKSVFAEVSSEDYMDSIWFDIQNAKEDIIENAKRFIQNISMMCISAWRIQRKFTISWTRWNLSVTIIETFLCIPAVLRLIVLPQCFIASLPL